MIVQKEKNLGYHISKGADDIYWILNDGEIFIKNLSKDFDTAVVKAKEYVGSNVDISVWHRSKKNFDFIAKPKQQDAHVDTHNIYLALAGVEAMKADCKARDYVGNIGDVFEKELTLVDSSKGCSQYGEFKIIYLKDENNNRYVYFGNAYCFNGMNKDHAKKIKFQIKKQYVQDKYLKQASLKYGIPSEIEYKINQISLVKNISDNKKYWVSLLSDKILDIDVLYTPSKNKKDVKFDFSFRNLKKEKTSFYPTGIKTFKQAKEFLHELSELNDKGKLTVEYLTNLTKESA